MQTLGETNNDIQEIERTLEAVLSSDSFATSTQLSRFLRFIVTKTLKGEQAELKAYTIAVDGLGRTEDFDPQSNAAVRVAAGRLRRALALFNADMPADLKVRISLAPGSYVPSFELLANELPINEKPALPIGGSEELLPGETEQNKHRGLLFICAIALAACIGLIAIVATLRSNDPVLPTDMKADINFRPRLALQFAIPSDGYPAWFRSDEVRDSIAYAISRFDDYEYMGVIDDDYLKEATAPNLDYLLSVSAYSRQNSVRVFGQLTRLPEERVLWSVQRLFDQPKSLNDRDLPAIAGTIYSAVASPYGVIYADILKNPSERLQLSCFTATYQYFSRKSDEAYDQAVECVDPLIKGGTLLPTVHAMRALLYLEEIRENRKHTSPDPLVAAERAALRAVELGPQSPRAHQALFAVRKVQRRFKEARLNGEFAIKLNPYDTDILADYAAWLISVGEVSKGNQLLTRVQKLLDAHPAWLEVFRFLASDLSGQILQADVIASGMDPTRSSMTAASILISSARQGDFSRAQTALSVLNENYPAMIENPYQSYIKRGFSDEIARKLDTQLKEALSALKRSN